MESWFPRRGSLFSRFPRFGANSIHLLLPPPAESREWAVSNVRIKKQQNSPTTGRPASRIIRATAMGPTPRRSTTPASGSPPFPTTITSTAPPHRGWRCLEGSTRPRSLERWGLVGEQVRFVIFKRFRFFFSVIMFIEFPIGLWNMKNVYRSTPVSIITFSFLRVAEKPSRNVIPQLIYLYILFFKLVSYHLVSLALKTKCKKNLQSLCSNNSTSVDRVLEDRDTVNGKSETCCCHKVGVILQMWQLKEK